jgi:hypothetical protein
MPNALRRMSGDQPGGAGDAERQRDDGGHHHGERQPLELRELTPGAPGEHDVGRPEGTGQQRKRDPGLLEVGKRGAQCLGDEHDPSGCGGDRDGIQPSARQRCREAEGADELDGHRDPDRQMGQRAVEGEVHQAEGDTERDHREPGATRVPSPAGADEDQQQGAGEEQAQNDGPAGADQRHERGGQRPAELHRDDASEHEEGCGDPVCCARHRVRLVVSMASVSRKVLPRPRARFRIESRTWASAPGVGWSRVSRSRLRAMVPSVTGDR